MSSALSSLPREIEELTRDVDNLYFLRDKCYVERKREMVKALKEQLLGKVTASFSDAPSLSKPHLHYLHGAVLNIEESYTPESNSVLQKSVKLNPSGEQCVKGWCMLGETFWKRGNELSGNANSWREGVSFLRQAEGCFESAIAKIDANGNAASLADKKHLYRQYSMLLRQLPPPEPTKNTTTDTAEPKSNPMQVSIDMAKKAIALDISDGESWYVLGNGYVSLYFNSGVPEHGSTVNTLTMATKVYDKAEKLWRESSRRSSREVEIEGFGRVEAAESVIPDLYYNRATVHLYLEDFPRALTDLRETQRIDPNFSHNVGERIERDVVGWCTRVCNLVKTRGGSAKSAKRLKQISKEIDKMRKMFEEAQSKVVDKDKVDNARTVHLRVLMPIGDIGRTPSSYLVIDGGGECLVLSVYRLGGEGRGIREGDVVTVLEAEVKNMGIETTDFGITEEENAKENAERSNQNQRGTGANNEKTGTRKGGEGGRSMYKCIQVVDPNRTVLINGQSVRRGEMAGVRARMQN